jgi:hypothetical protein
VSSCLLFNAHFLNLHGAFTHRLLDVHYRLHGEEHSFFIPNDMEISVRTLRWILTKAQRWTDRGKRRKITVLEISVLVILFSRIVVLILPLCPLQVTHYHVEDHLDPTIKDTTIHIAIYNQTLTTGALAFF